MGDILNILDDNLMKADELIKEHNIDEI